MNAVFCRMLTCPAAEMVDGSKLLYLEQVSFTESHLLYSIVLCSLFESANFLTLFFLIWILFFFFSVIRHFGGTLRNPFDRFVMLRIISNVLFAKNYFFFYKSSDGCSLQRFYMVKPCPKELKCDVEVGFLILFMNSVNNVYIFVISFLFSSAGRFSFPCMRRH